MLAPLDGHIAKSPLYSRSWIVVRHVGCVVVTVRVIDCSCFVVVASTRCHATKDRQDRKNNDQQTDGFSLGCDVCPATSGRREVCAHSCSFVA